jgi:hypothetical protein
VEINFTNKKNYFLPCIATKKRIESIDKEFYALKLLLRSSVVDPLTFWYESGCGSSDPYLCLTDPDADPGGPKTYGSYESGTGCGSTTLLSSKKYGLDPGPKIRKKTYSRSRIHRIQGSNCQKGMGSRVPDPQHCITLVFIPLAVGNNNNCK